MHKWKFFKSARCVQVKLETGADLLALKELDRKLWTVISASASGLSFDAATLAFLDADGDGRIRADDVLAAVDWTAARFKNLDFLFAGKDEVKLEDVNDGTADGAALLRALKGILARAGKADAGAVTLADVSGTTAAFNAQPFNGDGVVTPASTSDAAVGAAVAQIAACVGGVADRSGADGVDAARVEEFFAEAEAYLAWMRAGDAARTLGDGTAAAWAAYAAVEAKIDEYFTPPADLPLVTDAPDPDLPLCGNVHPLWRDAFRTFATACAAPALGVEKADSISRDEWKTIRAKMAPYGAWLAAKAGARAEAPGAEALAALVKNGAMKRAVLDLIDKDLALAEEHARLVDCERALRYAAHLVTWLRNYVNQANLYDTAATSVFHTGTLYIDGRACRLCFHVADEGAHAALAEKSKCCLVYVKLTRPGAAREVCAVVTAGTTAALYAGRNGLFCDNEGATWDAVVSKVVEAQISLTEAFWSPWAKVGNTISEQCKKFLATKQDAAVGKVTDGVTNATAAPAPAAPNGAALASSVAALGVGFGMAGAAVAGLVGLVAGLPLWKVLASVAAIVLVVSLPSVVLAWFKLRARDLGAILNAGGWAVNRPLYFSTGLARTFTVPTKLPAGAAVARDPYAGSPRVKVLLAILILVATTVAVGWKMGWISFSCGEPHHCGAHAHKPAAAAVGEAAASEAK